MCISSRKIHLPAWVFSPLIPLTGNSFMWRIFTHCFVRIEAGSNSVSLASLKLTCRSGWLWTHRDPHASASQVLALKGWATTPSPCSIYKDHYQLSFLGTTILCFHFCFTESFGKHGECNLIEERNGPWRMHKGRSRWEGMWGSLLAASLHRSANSFESVDF